MKQMEKFDLSKRVKELRIQRGITQEQLAESSGLSLRTIQRIENGETGPRGDTLKRLAVALQVSPDDIVDWKVQEDTNILTTLNLSQFGFLAFPLLGVVIPLAIWILKKDKVKNVDEVGKSILNFQITWVIVLCLFYLYMIASVFFHIIFPFSLSVLGLLYLFNITMILVNTVRCHRKKRAYYKPSLKILR